MATRTHRPERAHGGIVVAIGALAIVAGCQTSHRTAFKGPVIVSPSACADFTVSIYFESHSAAITPPARQVIADAAQRTRGCDVTGVHVTGLADLPGSPDANLSLSKQRADAVTRAFHQRGIDNVEFQVAAAGNTGARTPAGQALPLRRRADVQIHLTPKPPRPT